MDYPTSVMINENHYTMSDKHHQRTIANIKKEVLCFNKISNGNLKDLLTVIDVPCGIFIVNF